MKPSIAIAIPTFNGLNLLKKHLPSVVRHSQQAPITVIDDASTDGTLSWIKRTYPRISLITHPKNMGFAKSVNHAFKKLKEDLILLLNNDVSINNRTIPALTDSFVYPKIFAVGCLEHLPNDRRRGKSSLSWQRGIFTHCPAKTLDLGPTAWVFGASGVFRRSLFLKLGGFDTIYHPAYYEDIDLGLKAWKAGYRCLFQPKATVKHDFESTMSHFLGSKKAPLVFKNQFLFSWKHLDSVSLLLKHLIWLPYHLTLTNIKTNGAFGLGFLLALTNIKPILSTRRQNSPFTSSQVLSLFKTNRG